MSKKGSLKDIVVSNNITRKDFEYRKGDVRLAFSLRVDIKKELQEFKECMAQAIVDMDNEIARLNECK